MADQNISLSEYAAAVKQMSGQLASGWSEAAGRFAERVALEGGAHVLAETRKFELAAAELGASFRGAAENARSWADAARASGHDGAARVYDKYAERYYDRANKLLDSLVDKKTALDEVAREARAGAEAAEKALGGGFGRALGPAFDGAQMVEGLLDWSSTGNSDKFGGACMGVALSAGLGILGAALAVAVGLPAIAVAAVAGVAAIVGSALGDGAYGAFRDAVRSLFDSARDWRQPIDPLMLDLDGDGLELKRADGSILFDHNADTIRTGTGWIGSDDGILVRDLDANGTIDSGRELFGIDTLKSDGKNALICHGGTLTSSSRR